MKTDTDLLRAYVDAGDRGAFDQLMARHYAGVFQVALRLVHNEFDARDAAQNTFLKAVERAGTLRDPTRFRPWLLRIAVNEVRQQRRKRTARPADELELAFREARGQTAHEHASRREFELALERALERMPEHLKLPLVLHYYQALSLAEVAEVLELPKSTVQSRVDRALRLLRRRFRRQGAAALVPLMGERFAGLGAGGIGVGPTSSVLGGILAMKSKLLVPAVAILIAGLGLWLAIDADVFGVRAPEPDPGSTRHAPTVGPGPDAGAPHLAGASSGSPQEDPAPAGEPVRETVVHTEGDGRIAGRVLALRTHRPVRGARILVAQRPRLGDAWRAVDDPRHTPNVYWSGADGRFVCDQLPVGRDFDLVVSHPAFAYAERFGIEVRSAASPADQGVILVDARHALAGRVVDADGQPVAGADVRVGVHRQQAQVISMRQPPSPLRGARSQTNAEGRFRIDGLASGYHRVQVRAPGLATTSLRPQRVPGAPLEVVLAPAAKLVGVVVDDRDRPLEGADVQVWLDETVRQGSEGFVLRVPWHRMRSDATGRFEVTDLPGDAWRRAVVGVSLDGHVPREVEVELPAAGEVRVVLRARLPGRGARLRVRLVDGEGRWVQADPGRLTLYDESGMPVEGLAPSYDERRGAFEVEAVPFGRYHVGLEVPGFVETGIDVELKQGTVDVAAPLDRGWTLAGRVVDDLTGEPIEGATVRSSKVNRTVSAADGTFELRGQRVLRGSTQLGRYSASAPGYVSASPPVLWPTDATRHEHEFRLLPEHALARAAGVVLDRDGRPVVGARVSLQVADGRGGWRVDFSDAQGRFEILGLRPEQLTATARVRIAHPTYAGGEWKLPAEDRTALRFVIDAGRTVHGQVVTPTGEPIPHATVGAFRADRLLMGRRPLQPGRSLDGVATRVANDLFFVTQADARGRFRLDHAPREALRLVAFHPLGRWILEGGVVGAELAVDTDDAVTLTLRLGHVVRGTVVDPSGAPLPQVAVRAAGVTVASFTNGQGRFDLTPVFDDEVLVHISGSDYLGGLRVPGQDAGNLRLVAHPAGHLVGRVVDEDGQAVEGALVHVRNAGGETVRETQTRDGGAFRVHLPVGPVTLRITSADDPDRVATIDATVVWKVESELDDLVLR